MFYNTSIDNVQGGFFWYEQASGVASNNTHKNNKNNEYSAFSNQSSGDLELSNNNEE